MKIVHSDKHPIRIAPGTLGTATATEYPVEEGQSFNVAKISLKGVYPPDGGWARNKVSTMYVIVLCGTGIIYLRGENGSVTEERIFTGTHITIAAGQTYRWEAVLAPLELLPISSPPWTKDQQEYFPK